MDCFDGLEEREVRDAIERDNMGGGEGDRSDAGRSIADADKRRLFKTCISSMYRITSNVHAPPPPESRRLSSLPSLPSFRFSSEARSDQIVLDLIRF